MTRILRFYQLFCCHLTIFFKMINELQHEMMIKCFSFAVGCGNKILSFSPP